MVAIAAAQRGDAAALRALSEAVLTEVDRYGSNALHWASGAGHLDCVAYLVEGAGLDPSQPAEPPIPGDAPTTLGRTPLHFAARNGRLGCCRYLAGLAGVDADARAARGVSPLQLAVWRNHAGVARSLVEDSGVDALQVNDAGCGLAHWLCAAPRAVAGARGEALLPLLAWLEGRLGAAACGSGKNGVGHAPCHKAAFLGHKAVVDDRAERYKDTRGKKAERSSGASDSS